MSTSKSPFTKEFEQLSKEELQTSILNNLGDGFWYWDFTDDTLWYSDSFKEMLGYAVDSSSEDLIPWVELVHPDEHLRISRILDERIKNLKPFELEARFIEQAGCERRLRIRGKVNKSEKENTLRILGSAQDLSYTCHTQSQSYTQNAETELILDSLPQFVFYKDTNNKILRLNKSAANSIGLPKQMIEGRQTEEFYPALAATYLADDREVAKSGNPKLNIVEPYRGEGEQRWVRTDKIPLTGPKGTVDRLLVIASDITDITIMREELEESDKRFKTAFNNAPIGIAVGTLDGKFLKVNDTLCNVLGYSEQELLDTDFQSLSHPDELEENVKLLEETLAGKRHSYRMNKKYIRKDGQTIWAQLDVSLVCDVHKQPQYVIAQIQDITAARQAQDILRENEARLRIVIDNAPALIAYFDKDANYQLSNQRFQKWFAESDDSLKHKHLRDIVDDRIYDKLTESTDNNSLELMFPKGNTHRWVNASYIPEYDSKNQICGFFLFAVDINQQKLSALELIRSNRELDSFAHVASHDLKAPLRAINHYASWIIEDCGEQLNDQSREHLGKMQEQVLAMETLLNDLLDYSKLGKRNGDAVPLQTKEVVQSVISLIQPSKNYTLNVDQEMPSIVSAKAPIELVFRNLISNAMKHNTREDATISISSEDGEKYCKFSIADNGPGIAHQHHKRIFEMFQTIHPGDDRDGTGMGLAFVKKVVESQGGKVWLKSSEGQGSEFSFTWPKKAEAVSHE
jgi:PAS domain S-box-containing protein